MVDSYLTGYPSDPGDPYYEQDTRRYRSWNVASNWLMWTFKKDKKAGAMFVGEELRPVHQ
jgi:hypothetical protein